MKLIDDSIEFLKTPHIVKIAVLLFASVASFYIGKHFSNSQTLVFYSSTAASADGGGSGGGDAGPVNAPSVAISPNAGVTFNISALTLTLTPPRVSPRSPPVLPRPPPPPPRPPPPPPPPPPPSKFGIVDENGAMSDDFDVGEFDPDLVEKWDTENETGRRSEENGVRVRVRVRKYGFCDGRMREYIPCLDNVEEIKKLKTTERGERFERHCPMRGLDCLILPPKGYKVPIPWPRSRDEVSISRLWP